MLLASLVVFEVCILIMKNLLVCDIGLYDLPRTPILILTFNTKCRPVFKTLYIPMKKKNFIKFNQKM